MTAVPSEPAASAVPLSGAIESMQILIRQWASVFAALLLSHEHILLLQLFGFHGPPILQLLG